MIRARTDRTGPSKPDSYAQSEIFYAHRELISHTQDRIDLVTDLSKPDDFYIVDTEIVEKTSRNVLS